MDHRDSSGLLRVGLFNEETQLILNQSLVMSYNEEGEPVPMGDVSVRSNCVGDLCSSIKQEEVDAADQHHDIEGSENMSIFVRLNRTGDGYSQIYPDKPFGLSVFLPLHRRDEDEFFGCKHFHSEAIFQNYVAVAYALSMVNRVNPTIGVGAIIFDYCDREEKAQGQAFSYFSEELQTNYDDVIMKQDRIFGSLSLSDGAAEALSTILSSAYVPQFSSPVTARRLTDRDRYSLVMSSIPTKSAEVRIYLSLLKSFRWKYVSVLFDNNEVGRTMVQQFRALARHEDICIGDSLSIPERLSEEASYQVVSTLNAHWKPRIIILMMENRINIETL